MRGQGRTTSIGFIAATLSNFNILPRDVLRIIIGYTRPDEASLNRGKDGLPAEWLGYAGNLDTLLALSKHVERLID
jgi:hypothetical protein